MAMLRTKDDTVLHLLRHKNTLRSANIRETAVKTRITTIFSIKTYKRYVTPPRGLREKRAFANRGWDVVKVIWWKDLGRLSIQEARREIVSYVDTIYAMIANQNKPIVALRVTLVDWKTGKAIPTRILRDPWYFTTSFGRMKLDAIRLRSWGIAIDPQEIQYEKNSNTRQARYGLPVKLDEHSLKTLLEQKTNLDVDRCIDIAIYEIIADLPRLLREAVNFIIDKTKKFPSTNVLLQRHTSTMRSKNFRSRIMLWLDDKASDNLFVYGLNKPNGQRNLVKAIKGWILEDLIIRV